MSKAKDEIIKELEKQNKEMLKKLIDKHTKTYSYCMRVCETKHCYQCGRGEGFHKSARFLKKITGKSIEEVLYE